VPRALDRARWGRDLGLRRSARALRLSARPPHPASPKLGYASL